VADWLLIHDSGAAVAAPFVQRVCARKIAEFGYLLRKAMMVCICMY